MYLVGKRYVVLAKSWRHDLAVRFAQRIEASTHRQYNV
jgi:hypothetical protein